MSSSPRLRIGSSAGHALVGLFVIGRALAGDHEPTDTVTVLAAKRAEPLQSVPMAVSVLSGADLESAGITDLGSTARRLPMLGMQSSVSAVTTTLRIRGIGNLGNIPTFEPAVALFIDGAYRSRSMLGTQELLDVERIEVLSGPQSTLYGKSASAGVIAIYTREPTSQLNAAAELTGGWIDGPGSTDLDRPGSEA